MVTHKRFRSAAALAVLMGMVLLPGTIFCELDISAGGTIPFIKHSVTSTFDGSMAVYATDLDGDTDIDILGVARLDGDVAWWENDGTGTLTAHLIDDDFTGAFSVYAADVDGDDDIDVLGAADTADSITWWESSPSGNPPPADPYAWTEHTIADDFEEAASVYATDVDSDGDIDVLGAARSDDGIKWWENIPSGEPPPADPIAWTEHIIADTGDPASSVYAVDLDGDTDIDVLGAATWANDVLWWENDGSELFTDHTIAGDFSGAWSVYATDVDKDGDVDVLGAADMGDRIAWWENQPSGNLPPDDPITWTEHTIATDFDGARSVYAIDLEDDGDVDVVGAACFADDITWWENDGSQNFTGHTIDDSFDGPHSVYAADVNGDSKADILGAALVGDEIAWWEQGSAIYVAYLPLVLKTMVAPSAPVLDYISNPGGLASYTTSWSAVSGANNYVLEEDDSPDFSSPITVYSGRLTSALVSVDQLGTYYYRVRASNVLGASDWSNVQSVEVLVLSSPCPQAGYWSDDDGYPNFTVVHEPQCQAETFTIKYSVACADCPLQSSTTTFSTPLLIEENHFEAHTTKLDVAGDFTSPIYVEGTWSSSYSDFLCGQCSGSGTWSASYNSP